MILTEFLVNTYDRVIRAELTREEKTRKVVQEFQEKLLNKYLAEGMTISKAEEKSRKLTQEAMYNLRLGD